VVPPGPPTRRDDVVDVLHGVAVPDPYRWLEDGAATEVAAWAAAQNERTRQALDARPDRQGWHERLVALLGARVSAGCQLAGDRVFAMERAGGQAQFALVVRSAVAATVAARLVLDPSSLAADAAVAIDWYHPSPDGALVAYGTSEGGDERSVLRIVDVESGAHRDDVIPETRAASLGWLPDASGFLYTRYPEGDEYHRMVYAHTLGTDWHDDALVWSDLPTPESWPDVAVSPDGRWAVVHVLVGWGRVDVHLLERETGAWRTLVSERDALTHLSFAGDRLVGTTTWEAPRGRVVAVPLAAPDAWVTLVPEGDGVLEGCRPAGGELLVTSTLRAVGRLHRYGPDGVPLGEVALPELGSFAGFDARPERRLAFCQLESFTRPGALFRWTPDGGLERWPADAGRVGGAGESAPVDPSSFAVHQVRYPSLDGTEIGLFLVHRADVTPDAGTPTILNGYGGFAIASSPAWSPGIAAWCERGGLYAIAGLRGGYEEGEDWHRAGRREHKQRVFDDFAAAATYLVDTGRTSPSRLAMRGGSNGGLLVGAALTQHPELARAVHCAVPLLDMVRYPQFLIARLWTDEYGDPDVAEEFAWLWAYSPYHHVAPGVCFPAVLFTAAEGDSRVDALHARKMAAALQAATSCEDEHPILLRQEGRAGHGVGKPLLKQADELADVMTFFSWQLGAPSP
jgi:prolyl oligopeptidase